MTEETETIYILLPEESFWRPTEGVPLGDGVYRVLATPGYEHSEEVWEFPPGSVVQCIPGDWEGKRLMFARELIRAP